MLFMFQIIFLIIIFRVCEDIRCFGNYLINYILGKILVIIVKLGKNFDDIENGIRNNNEWNIMVNKNFQYQFEGKFFRQSLIRIDKVLYGVIGILQ